MFFTHDHARYFFLYPMLFTACILLTFIKVNQQVIAKQFSQIIGMEGLEQISIRRVNTLLAEQIARIFKNFLALCLGKNGKWRDIFVIKGLFIHHFLELVIDVAIKDKVNTLDIALIGNNRVANHRVELPDMPCGHMDAAFGELHIGIRCRHQRKMQPQLFLFAKLDVIFMFPEISIRGYLCNTNGNANWQRR